MTMTWKRERPGIYTAGPFRVEQLSDHVWLATGPGSGLNSPGALGTVRKKEQAQALCAQIADIRAANVMTMPVVGDFVLTNDGRRGQVSTILPPRGNHNEDTRLPLYCIKFTRGKRLCLFRREFMVVIP